MPVERELESKVTFIYTANWHPSEIERVNPDIIIGINEYHFDMAKCYEVAKRLNIPTLTIQDGILEWRFMFENAIYNGNETGIPMHHPVLADKYACIGPLMAHFISELGNSGKVEIVGMPKLEYLVSALSAKKKSSRKKILILTSSKPWFNEDQFLIVKKSLLDLKEYFEQHREVEPIWRITKGLDKHIGVNSSYGSKNTYELAEQINQVDAVITTISTTIVEAMLLNKPVCTLDYFNTPLFIPTVWSIRSADQVESVVNSVLNASPQQLWMQNAYKDLIIYTDESAAKRTARLIELMIDFRINNSKKTFPNNLLNSSMIDDGDKAMPNHIDFYPNRKIFQLHEVDFLKNCLIRAERENQIMRKELQKRSIGGLALGLYGKIVRRLK